MDTDRLIEIARAAMAGRKDHPARERGYTFHHGLRTARIALRLAGLIDEAVGTPQDVLFAGALFHDVGKAVEPHNETGAARVGELLAGELAAEQLALVQRIVREHNRRAHADECCTAGRVVQDADVLDHFGTQSVWLCFHWQCTHEGSCDDALAFYDGPANRDYLEGSRRALNFEAARRIYDERVAFERAFFDRFAAEAAGQVRP